MVAREARARLQELANDQAGVVSRAQARELGVDARIIAREVAAGRWRAVGRTSVAVHLLDLSQEARCRVAAWEAHPDAVLDGATSLWVAGLKNFDDGIHVLCRWPNGGTSILGSRIHNSRLWDPEDFVEARGIRRTRNDVAAIRAAMYARTDRAAALVMAMAVQQRFVTGAAQLRQAERLNRHKRRPFIVQIAQDIADGAQALGELDFAVLCRRYGLPAPDRQGVRQNALGRWYRDVEWDLLGVVVEIEGVHHDAPENAVEDSLRQNEFTIDREAVLRIPLLGLRVAEAAFMGQVERMLVRAGWRRAS